MPSLITTAETAERLKVSRKTVLELVKRGKLSPVRLSRRAFRFPSDIVERLEAATLTASTESSEGGE
jgi:excisionase family DNA binding protein